MVRHALKVVLRQLRHQPAYTLGNLLGLSIGIACCLLIGLYVRHELSYDRFHTNADRLVRVVSTFQRGEEPMDYATAPAPVGPALQAALPEVEAAVRFRATSEAPVRVAHKGRTSWEPRFLYADASVFEAFSFDLLTGDPASALVAPFSMVLTEQTARRFFGDADPMGLSLTVAGKGLFTVTGVAADVPETSHLHFDFLASLSTDADAVADPNEWKNTGYYTYLLLRPGATPETVRRKLPAALATAMPVDTPHLFAYHIQPLTRIHLHSRLRQELASNGRIEQIYLFSGIALLVLLVACLNYANLAAAQATARAREVGVRMAIGAGRRQLVRQFLAEAFLLVAASFIVALLVTFAVLPTFSMLTERPLQMITLTPGAWLGVLGLIMAVTLIAGGYPAFILAALRPARVLKGAYHPGPLSAARQGMVVAQLAIATILLVGTIVVRQQLEYLRTQPLGFDAEQVVALPMHGDAQIHERYPALKQAFLQHTTTRAVAASSGTPGRPATFYSNPVQVGDEQWHTVRSLVADVDFVATYNLDLLAGRLPAMVSDVRRGDFFPGEFLVNETLVHDMGWTSAADALGRVVNWKGNVQGEIVGVVADFHYLGLQQTIEPTLITGFAPMYNYLSVRLAVGYMAAALRHLEADWRRLLPEHPFTPFFVDADYDRQYRAEQRLAYLIGAFSSLAMLLAGLGLFGLASHTARQRTREIGVRKALGAGVGQLVGLLTTGFLKLGMIALLLALPVAYVAAHRWLDHFAYRTFLSPGLFLLAAGLVLLLAFTAVSYRAVQAALMDPVRCLRQE